MNNGSIFNKPALELTDHLLIKAEKLNALLQMTTCDAAEAFNYLDPHVRDVYLYTCSELAIQIKDIANQLANGRKQ